jgi:hypothetical protein
MLVGIAGSSSVAYTDYRRDALAADTAQNSLDEMDSSALLVAAVRRAVFA